MDAGLRMALLSRKGLLAIAAVIDVALHGRGGRCRPRPWPRGMLCRRAISSRCCRRWCGSASCKGIRGPRGGYELARERRRITADDILRAAGTIEDASDPPATAGSALLNEVVIPAVGQAERAFSVALGRINLDELVRKAEPLRMPRSDLRSLRNRCHFGTCVQPATPRRHRRRSRSGLFRRDSACA